VDPATGAVSYVNPDGSAPATAKDVVVDDVLPAGTTLIRGSWSTLCGQDHPGGYLDESTLRWHVGDIKPGQSFSLCFKVRIEDDATGTLTNVAEVFAMDTVNGPNDIDSTPGNRDTTPGEDDDDSVSVTLLQPDIDLEKQVEVPLGSGTWVDADFPDGELPAFLQGAPVRYRFVVENTGQTRLINVTVADPQLVNICGAVLAQPFNLAVGETHIVECMRPSGYLAGLHVNTATATGQPTPPLLPNTPVGPPVDDTDTAQVEVHRPAIDIVKYTNGVDADTAAEAVPLLDGDDVTWTYVITNRGTEPLVDINLLDDRVSDVTIDENHCEREDGAAIDAPLPVDGTITCEWPGTAETVGLYRNVADVDATGAVTGLPVSDDNPSHYVTTAPQPDITLVKSTVTDHTDRDGEDADTPEEAPFATPGTQVSWVYEIINTGNADLVLTSLVDDIEGDVDLSACTRADGLAIRAPLPPLGTAVCRLTGGVADVGDYANVGDVEADVVNNTGQPTGETVSDDDPSHYFGMEPKLAIVKSVCRFVDADRCDPDDDSVWFQQRTLPRRSKPIWMIEVSNVGNIDVDHAVVTDEVAPGCARDLGLIEVGESVRFSCESGSALTHETTNVAVVVGTPVDDNGVPITEPDTGEPIKTTPVDDDAVAVPPNDDDNPPPGDDDNPPPSDDDNPPSHDDTVPPPIDNPTPTPEDGSGWGWLPNTGAGSGVLQLAAIGVLALVIGSTVLVRDRLRNRRSR
jgi:hypothetical protein